MFLKSHECWTNFQTRSSSNLVSITLRGIESKISADKIVLIYYSNNSDSADWSRHMTVEERQFITKKIRTAYQRKAPTYEELLDACCAIEEEFVFMVAPSRLDYFKSGVQYEKRIVGKISGLRRSAATASTGEAVIVDETSRGIKRAKTQH